MSHRDVRLAEIPERLTPDQREKCSPLPVQLVAVRLEFLSDQERTVLYTVPSALQRAVSSNFYTTILGYIPFIRDALHPEFFYP